MAALMASAKFRRPSGVSVSQEEMPGSWASRLARIACHTGSGTGVDRCGVLSALVLLVMWGLLAGALPSVVSWPIGLRALLCAIRLGIFRSCCLLLWVPT